jgi:hypothetical protein
MVKIRINNLLAEMRDGGQGKTRHKNNNRTGDGMEDGWEVFRMEMLWTCGDRRGVVAGWFIAALAYWLVVVGWLVRLVALL